MSRHKLRRTPDLPRSKHAAMPDDWDTEPEPLTYENLMKWYTEQINRPLSQDPYLEYYLPSRNNPDPDDEPPT